MNTQMDTMEKLRILTDAAKYDAACTSSGVNRAGVKGQLGSAAACGICHSFASDGRCISLLKVLMTNICAYDCTYCLNRRSNDTPRATFRPQELADLTISFYRRNYIEGLFLSSAVFGSPDITCERMLETLHILRNEYHFNGYIHVKAIPGADETLLQQLGLLADRMSVNIELPSNDRRILQLSEGLYHKYSLKRVFYSAYIPVVQDRNLPALDTAPPLLREHRLYQADWLLRFYGFTADELLSEKTPDLDPMLDPKCSWAVRHPEEFPVEVNRAPYEKLLRVPGIGVVSAKRIIRARRQAKLDHEGLKKLGVVLKRASYFITCNGKMQCRLRTDEPAVLAGILRDRGLPQGGIQPEIPEQLSLFNPTKEDAVKCLTGQL